MERFKVKKAFTIREYEGTPLEGTNIDESIKIEKGMYAEIFPTIYCIDNENEKDLSQVMEDKDMIEWYKNTFMTIVFTHKPEDYEEGEPFSQLEDWVYYEDFNFMDLPKIIKKYNLEVISCTK